MADGDNNGIQASGGALPQGAPAPAPAPARDGGAPNVSNGRNDTLGSDTPNVPNGGNGTFAAAEDVAKRLLETEAKAAEYLAGWQRERADFQNYKKDELKRLTEMRGMIAENFAHDALPVLDSFDMAFDFLPEEPAAHKWAKGVEQVRQQLLDTLKRMGMEPMKVEEGKTMFDPAQHEAVEEVASDKPEGTVVEEMQKGYAMNGRTLRPARVKVAKKASSSA